MSGTVRVLTSARRRPRCQRGPGVPGKFAGAPEAFQGGPRGASGVPQEGPNRGWGFDRGFGGSQAGPRESQGGFRVPSSQKGFRGLIILGLTP